MSDMADKILKSFDVWIAAQGIKSRTRLRSVDNISLEGIARLRELILEFAIQGKLVEQDSSEDDAASLLFEIRKQRDLLIKEGKLKRQNSTLPPIASNDKLPKGWRSERLGTICFKLTDGSHNPPKDSGSGYPMLSSQNVINGLIDFINPSRYVSEEDFLNENQRTQIEPGDVLLTIVASLGRAAVVPSDAPKFLLQRSVAVIRTNLNPKFLALQLIAPDCKRYYDLNGKGTAQKGIYLGQLSLMELVIPPLAEQHRIVAKVEELMALCDELEKQETQHLKSHALLVETLLGTLTQAKDAKEFQKAWSLLAQHFDDLFTTEDSIDQLKQTILQLAVMGKLVPQDPKDEPASVLLERIRMEKERLFNEGEISKPKEFRILAKEEEPFILPSNWIWTHLGNTGIGSTGKTPSTNNPEYFGGDIPFIGPGQINESGEISLAEKFLTESGGLQSEVAKRCDILMVCIGGSIGKSAIVKSIMTFNQQINSIRPVFINSEYLNAAMNARYFQKQLLEKATGSATPIINRGKWEELPVPVAPLNEQQRIVSKVNELFALCDGLKARLVAAQTLANQLAEGVVSEV